MDRDRVTKPNAQIGFIRFVLLPLFESLSKVTRSEYCLFRPSYFYLRATIFLYISIINFQLFPEFENISLNNLRNALTYYENLKDKEEMKRAATTSKNTDNNSVSIAQ